jgi:hypothetical protein
LPPGLADVFPYHIIPRTARSIPRITWTFRPSLPKKRNPRDRTSTVYSGKPPNADELAQINANGNEAWECQEKLQSQGNPMVRIRRNPKSYPG